MFTLFPYESSASIAKILNDEDLNKQIHNVNIILNTLHQVNDVSGWDDAPGVLMWKDYEAQLCVHGLELCAEYERTGQTHNLEARLDWHLDCAVGGSFSMKRPAWTSDPVLHLAHQSYMVRMNSGYRAFFPVSANLDMLWPVTKIDG